MTEFVDNSPPAALLALEDGTVFEGYGVGLPGTYIGEVVFNTGMTGYQEMMTDPSYAGQILTFTYPLIGNYGVNNDDHESRKCFLRGIIARELCGSPSNWRSLKDIDKYLRAHEIMALSGVDTRAITRHIRSAGAMMGVLTTELTAEAALHEAREADDIVGRDLVGEVSCEETWVFNPESRGRTVAMIDCGAKYNIARHIAQRGFKVVILPAKTSVDEVLSHKPAGIVLSNGPGDPEGPAYLPEVIRTLGETHPLFGICMGHQLISLAFGAKMFKLKFGHHGSNHPVKDLATGKVSITSQNHGFAVSQDSLKETELELTHLNLNDNTVEGVRHKRLPVWSVQYHPEAAPGPRDNHYIFDEFIEKIG